MNQKVIVTLTTIPERLKNQNPFGFIRTIYSLMNLSWLNYEVHINIPHICKSTNEEYVIPEWLTNIKDVHYSRNHKVIRIFRTEDYGPATKLYPTVNRISDPNQVIIVVDDDLAYESRMINEHLKLREKDNQVVWGFAGLNTLDTPVGGPQDRFVIGVNTDTRVSIIEHYKSVSYVRGMFESDFNDDFIGKGWADDHLISAYLGMKNIKKMVAHTEYIPKYSNDDEWRRYGVVESFPVIEGVSSGNSTKGCNLWRKDNVPELYDNELYKYLKQ